MVSTCICVYYKLLMYTPIYNVLVEHFLAKQLDIHISLGFLVCQEVTLTNTSEIPMTYHLRISQPSRNQGALADDAPELNEFQIVPDSGTLPPNFHQVIQVHVTRREGVITNCTCMCVWGGG